MKAEDLWCHQNSFKSTASIASSQWQLTPVLLRTRQEQNITSSEVSFGLPVKQACPWFLLQLFHQWDDVVQVLPLQIHLEFETEMYKALHGEKIFHPDLSRSEANIVCTACSIVARGRSNCCDNLPATLPQLCLAKHTRMKTWPIDSEVTDNLSDAHQGE